MTVYTYDTEFRDDGTVIDLVSIGIVADDGREYYAVSSEFDQGSLKRNPWLLKHVWSQLPVKPLTTDYGMGMVEMIGDELDLGHLAVRDRATIAAEVEAFLLAGATVPSLWAYYGAYDHVALAQLWGPMMDLPDGIPMFTHEIMQEIERRGVSKRALPNNTNAHNALDDARWNMKVLWLLGVVVP